MVLDSIRIIGLDHPLPGRFPACLQRFSPRCTDKSIRLTEAVYTQKAQIIPGGEGR